MAAVAIGSKSMDYMKSRQQAREDDQRAKKIIKQIAHEIEQAKQAIINELRYQRHKDLEGDIVGLGLSLQDYAVRPNLDFLNHILSRTGNTLGDLLVIVKRVDRFDE